LASQKSPSPIKSSQKYATPPTNAGLKYSQTPPPHSNNNNNNNNDSKNPFLVAEPIVAPLATSETLVTPGMYEEITYTTCKRFDKIEFNIKRVGNW
jgi:hypothetical protein